ISNRFHRYTYSLGHLFVRIDSPLLEEPVFTGMRSVSHIEKLKLYLIKKVGMGIIGAAMKGEPDTKERLEKTINHILFKNEKIAFIKYRLNRESAIRVISFLELFLKGDEEGFVPCEYYGGDFWPGFKNEGSGCSAFGLAMMEAAGISTDKPEWIAKVNMQEEIVGGNFNNNRKVKISTIRSCEEWYNGDGIMNKDYFPIVMYDPSMIHDWIKEKYYDHLSVIQEVADDYYMADIEGYLQAVEQGCPFLSEAPGYFTSPETAAICNESGIRGVCIDARHIEISPDKPLLKERASESVFVNVFKKELGLRKAKGVKRVTGR
ncbi:MAG: hypothetical protein M0P27_06975, partial [Bacteroidales bacterium]|nr:hypothetical protein [Bacteroidales bacterium]